MNLIKTISDWLEGAVETITEEFKKVERLLMAVTGQIENIAEDFLEGHKQAFERIANLLDEFQKTADLSKLEESISNSNLSAAQAEAAAVVLMENVQDIIREVTAIDSFQSMSMGIGKEVDMIFGGIAGKGIAIPINNSPGKSSVPVTSVELDVGIQIGIGFSFSFGFWKDTNENLAGEGYMISMTAAMGPGLALNVYFNDDLDVTGFTVAPAGGIHIEAAAGYSWTSTDMKVWRENNLMAPSARVVDTSGRQNWVKRPGLLKHVSVNGREVWGVNAQDRIYQWNGTGWDPKPGLLKQISCGGSEVWGVNAQDQVYRWNGERWEQQPGLLKHVSAGSTTNMGGTEVWGVNAQDHIYRWNGERWEQQPGLLKQISVGDGLLFGGAEIWGVNSQDHIYRWNGDGWDQIPGRLKYVSVAEPGFVWGVNADDVIYRYADDRWHRKRGRLKQLSVSTRVNVWGVNHKDHIYFSHDLL